MEEKTINKRLLSLDVLRGITVAGMILVNNTGTCGYNYAPFRHASWNGFTPADLVFPMFIFLMGISTYISLKKYASQKTQAVKKIIKRSVLLIVIGILMEVLIMFFNEGVDLNLSNLRLMGVMQRLGICYGFTAILSLYVPHKHFLKIAFSILLGYFFIQLMGDGFEKTPENIIGIIDRAILGESHVYLQGKQFVDPEGLLSTLPAIAQVMIGFICGKRLIENKNLQQKMLFLYAFGAMLLIVGYLFSYSCPINKRLWSPSFVLVTSGVASLLLALLVNILDVKLQKKWAVFFETFGANPLVLYITASILAPFLKVFDVPQVLFNNILNPLFGNYFGSFMYGALFLIFLWGLGYILLKKRIYIKL